jgi:hypothetical protein
MRLHAQTATVENGFVPDEARRDGNWDKFQGYGPRV